MASAEEEQWKEGGEGLDVLQGALDSHLEDPLPENQTPSPTDLGTVMLWNSQHLWGLRGSKRPVLYPRSYGEVAGPSMLS